ncbi:MAG: ADP-glyceromanno-heptose 6-epimerase [Ignavibacteria bacterium]|nr:ADP-glyceromanno-heptose 6-epimerase [Ignavibacteria bacterium]
MIIVTGGAGFIGSALVWRLNQLGVDDIFIVDEFGKDDKYKNLLNLKFYDLIDKEEFGHIISQSDDFLKQNRVDTIFHLGACSATTEQDLRYLLINNYEYTKYLCGISAANDIRFIYASSAATYGDGSMGYYDDEKKLYTLRPLNKYGYSKHLFDLWALKNGYLNSAVGLKYFNVYGPNEYHKDDMRSMANKAFDQIKSSGKVRLFKSDRPEEYSDGEQKRDFIYIKDAVEMTLHFWHNKIYSGIYNIGTGNASSFNALIKPVFKAMNLAENIEYFDMPDILKGRYQDFTQANINKLRQTGYDKEITNIEDAVIDYTANYMNTDDPYLK